MPCAGVGQLVRVDRVPQIVDKGERSYRQQGDDCRRHRKKPTRRSTLTRRRRGLGGLSPRTGRTLSFDWVGTRSGPLNSRREASPSIFSRPVFKAAPWASYCQLRTASSPKAQSRQSFLRRGLVRQHR